VGIKSKKNGEPSIDPMTSSFIQPSTKITQLSKSHELENINQKLYNRYPDTTNLNLNTDQGENRHNQSGRLHGKPSLWVIIYFQK